ncbi:MAG: hypothetical protein WC969_00755 [Elusimicrobiota bacterium]|jgi:hypothetical protein
MKIARLFIGFTGILLVAGCMPSMQRANKTTLNRVKQLTAEGWAAADGSKLSEMIGKNKPGGTVSTREQENDLYLQACDAARRQAISQLGSTIVGIQAGESGSTKKSRYLESDEFAKSASKISDFETVERIMYTGHGCAVVIGIRPEKLDMVKAKVRAIVENFFSTLDTKQ